MHWIRILLTVFIILTLIRNHLTPFHSVSLHFHLDHFNSFHLGLTRPKRNIWPTWIAPEFTRILSVDECVRCYSAELRLKKLDGSQSILEPMVARPWNSSPHLDRLLVQNKNVSDCVQVLNSHQDSWWGIYMVRAALRALLCAVCESWVATLWCACNLLLSEAKLPCTYYLHWLRYMAQSWSGRHLDQTSAAGSWTTCQPQTSGKSPRLSTRQCASQVVRANLERW